MGVDESVGMTPRAVVTLSVLCVRWQQDSQYIDKDTHLRGRQVREGAGTR